MKNMRALQILFPVLFAGFMTLLASCGGGGGDGYSSPAAATPPVATTVTGVAASGKPIAGKTVTVKDAAGNSATGTTAADGSFKVTSTTTFTPPFVVQVSLGAGASLYSVSADTSLTTNINVTPLTDLVVRSWYNVRGVATDAAFNALATNPPPATATVQILGSTVQGTVQLWLNKAGVPSTNFNLISTPFKADSTGVDKVLDQSTVTNASNSSTLNITDGATTQTSTLLAASGSVTVTTTTKVVATNTIASTSVQVVPIVTLASQQTDLSKALAGVQTLFTNLISVASSKGAAFSATDAAAFVDPQFLGDLFGLVRTNSVNVGQRNDHALVSGDINPGNSSHVLLHAPQDRNRNSTLSQRFHCARTAKSPVGAR